MSLPQHNEAYKTMWNAFLDAQYTVFGGIVEGLPVSHQIIAVKHKPVTDR